MHSNNFLKITEGSEMVLELFKQFKGVLVRELEGHAFEK